MKTTLCALSLLIGLNSLSLLSYAQPKLVEGAFSMTTVAAKTAPAAKPAQPAKKPAETTSEEKQKGIIDNSYKDVQALNLLRDSEKWIGEKVSFEGTFISFSPYALDYKGAMRASKDYIAFLIQRPDARQHTIPLSELKLIYPRKKADEVMDLEGGDRILVRGKVFSAALGDPWLDVDEIVLLKKSPENLAKSKNKKKPAELE